MGEKALSTNIDKAMSRVCSNDRTALADLYKLTSPQVYGALCRLLDDQDARKHVLTETYREVWNKRRERMTMASGHSDWILAIAHRHALLAHYRGLETQPSGKKLATNILPIPTMRNGVLEPLNEDEAKLILSAYLDGNCAESTAQVESPTKADSVERMVKIVNKMRGRSS